jgi:hypothetical protein
VRANPSSMGTDAGCIVYAHPLLGLWLSENTASTPAQHRGVAPAKPQANSAFRTSGVSQATRGLEGKSSSCRAAAWAASSSDSQNAAAAAGSSMQQQRQVAEAGSSKQRQVARTAAAAAGCGAGSATGAAHPLRLWQHQAASCTCRMHRQEAQAERQNAQRNLWLQHVSCRRRDRAG